MRGKRDLTDTLSEAPTVRQAGAHVPAPAPSLNEATTNSGRKRSSKSRTPAEAVEAYLAALPVDEHGALQRVRKIIKEMVPAATEALSYQIPTVMHHGPLVGFSASKRHCSFFVMSRAVMKTFEAELASFYTGPGTLRFSITRPLPPASPQTVFPPPLSRWTPPSRLQPHRRLSSPSPLIRCRSVRLVPANSSTVSCMRPLPTASRLMFTMPCASHRCWRPGAARRCRGCPQRQRLRACRCRASSATSISSRTRPARLPRTSAAPAPSSTTPAANTAFTWMWPCRQPH